MKIMKYVFICLLIGHIFITSVLTYAEELNHGVTDSQKEEDKTFSSERRKDTSDQIEIVIDESEDLYTSIDNKDINHKSIYHTNNSNAIEVPIINEQEVNVSSSEKSVESLTVIGEGSLGTSKWYVDSAGTLHIESGIFGDTVSINNGNSPFYQYASQIRSIVFEGPVTAGESLSSLFSTLTQVKSIDNLLYLNTSQTKDMSRMFLSMSNLESLDLTDFDTTNVTNMSMMFYGLRNLIFINVSSFNTNNVTDMNNMFQNTSKLKNLDLSSFYTENLLSMDYMFMWSGINSLDLSNFDTSNTSLTKNTFYRAPIKNIKIGENFEFKDSVIDSPITNESYTGKWQNIGHGTENNPLGNNVWTSEEFRMNYNGIIDADTYVWQPVRYEAEKLTVDYQDTEGNSIADSQIITGNIGDSYDVSGEEYKLEIAGYTFKEVKGELKGILTDKAQTVTYVYTKDPVKAEKLTVDYQDTEGNSIADSQIITRNIGDSYDVSGEEYKLEIAGYTFKEVKGELKGTLTDEAQTVTYVYTKNTGHSNGERNQIQKSGNKDESRKAILLPKAGEEQTFYLSLMGIIVLLSSFVIMYRRTKIKN